MVNARYVSSSGNIVDLSRRPYILTEDSELRNYKWEYTDNGIALTGIKRGVGIAEKNFNVFIYATSYSAASSEKNEICNIFESDVAKEKFGRLYIGDYYLNCFIVSSEKSGWSVNKMRMTVGFTLVTDNPIWCKETTTAFKHEAYFSQNSGEIDYPYNYPYNYTAVATPILINPSVADAGFAIRIYGPCVNPNITIAENAYAILTTLSENEQVIITSNNKEKTVVLSSYGTESNIFSFRDRTCNNFKKIPPGENIISWNHSFDFDVTIISERSEPEWI